jgi:protein SCO1/2
MGRISRVWIYVVVLVGVASLSAWGLEYYKFRIAKLPVYGPVDRINGIETHHTIPAYYLTAQDGSSFSSESITGKIVVANFFFTSCTTICPRMMHNLQTVHEQYRNDEDVMFISTTVDPVLDTPERLSRYAEHINARDNWRFLTGDKPVIYELARHGYFLTASEGNGGEHDFVHSESIVLVDTRGRIRGYYNGLDEKSMKNLASDISKLKKDKS